MVIGIIVGYYIAKYKKSPTDEDMVEMNEMVEMRMKEIKKSYSDIRFIHKE